MNTLRIALALLLLTGCASPGVGPMGDVSLHEPETAGIVCDPEIGLCIITRDDAESILRMWNDMIEQLQRCK